MNKINLAILMLVLVVSGLSAAPNTKIYTEQGGSRMVVDGGGGGEIDFEDGEGLEIAGVDALLQNADGNHLKRTARFTYDTATDGGTAGQAYGLGVSLPANAIVQQAWFQIITQFSDAGSGTVALHCASANDIFSATDITGSSAGTITAGVPTGVAANMFDVGSSACEITATVATSSQDTGKLVGWIDYVISE